MLNVKTLYNFYDKKELVYKKDFDFQLGSDEAVKWFESLSQNEIDKMLKWFNFKFVASYNNPNRLMYCLDFLTHNNTDEITRYSDRQYLIQHQDSFDRNLQ